MAKAKIDYRLHYLTNSSPDRFTSKKAADKEYNRAKHVACVWLVKDGKIVRSNTTLKAV
jgi:hypothetical protein